MQRSGGASTRSNRSQHHHQNHSQQNRRPHRQETGIDFVSKVKYTNTLPDLPFQPKFLQSPFISLSRFVNYKPSTLEKNFKYELLTEPDLNVKIDLINPSTYQMDSTAEKPQMHPIDEQLLEDESVTQLNTKRSIQHRKVVPWMRKTEYISTEFNRYGIGGQGGETKVGFGMKNRIKDEPFEFKDRASQIAAIERTFSDAKKPIRRHYSRPGVTAVEEFPIFPDFELWKYPFAQVIFDADPLPYCKIHRQEKLVQAILRGMADSEGNQFVGYFSPFEEALVQRMADDKEEIGSYREGFEYQYTLEREYNWAVQNKASKGYEQENYFLIRRDSAFYYNELETRVKLARRAKSGASSSKNTLLTATNRPLNSKELSQMNHRANSLFAIQEEEEEEKEQEEEEATEEAAQQDGEETENQGEKKVSSDGEEEEKMEGDGNDEQDGHVSSSDENADEHENDAEPTNETEAKSAEEESSSAESSEENSEEEEND